MSVFAHRPAALETPELGGSRVGADGSVVLRLTTNDDGWALLGVDGQLVFSAPGIPGRWRCLQFARAHGVLVVLT
jgi:hypothetical protein